MPFAVIRAGRSRPAKWKRSHKVLPYWLCELISRRGGPHEHGHVADEIAGAGCPEDLFLSIAGLEDLEPAAQDYSQSEIALAGLEKDLAAAQNAPRAERFEHCKLPVIQFGKGDALSIAIELLVIIGFSRNWIGLRAVLPIAPPARHLSIEEPPLPV